MFVVQIRDDDHRDEGGGLGPAGVRSKPPIHVGDSPGVGFRASTAAVG